MCSSPTTKKQRVQLDAYLVHQEPDDESNKKRFLDLPIDVLTDVFQYLEPAELLYLSRTTKALRAFLLNRHKSQCIWKTAFHNVPDLPPCPDHLSEPAYAHLAFISVCHTCFNPCNTIEWEIRMRCCPRCRQGMTVIPYLCGEKVTDRILSVHLPMSNAHLELRKNDMNVAMVTLPAIRRPSDWIALLKRAKHSSLLTKKFVEQEDELWKPIVKHAKLCREWESRWLHEQVPRLKVIRDERISEIKRNFQALGWTDDILSSTSFQQHSAVNKPEPLTPTEWLDISPKLTEFLSKVKRTHMARTLHNRLGQFRRIFPRIRGLNPHPRTIDIALHPSIRGYLENDLDTKMCRNTMSERLGPILPVLIQQWHVDAVDAFTLFVQQELGPDVSVNQANLVFGCTQCQDQCMDFKTALSHEHLYPPDADMGKKRQYGHMEESKIYEEVGIEVCRSRPRSLSVLWVHKSASEQMEGMVRDLGDEVSIIRSSFA